MLLAALLCGGAATAFAQPKADERGPDPHDPTTLLVKFKDPSTAATKVKDAGDTPVVALKTKAELVKIQPGESVEAKVREYRARNDVVYAEPNFLRSVDLAEPNDPSYGSQYALANISAVAGWGIFPSSYTGSGGVTLAIIDTGVDATHPDLSTRVVTGADCTSGTCVRGATVDKVGHGTHVAGIAGAATNNGVGVAGVAYDSPILPVKVCASTSCSIAAIAAGVAWATDNSARVLNMSLGGSNFSQTECDAVAYAISHNVVVVAAAGNDGTGVASYPAACAGALGVAASDSTDARASFSNYGAPDVFVSAPGVDVYSTYPVSMGSYATLSGTSMAAPFVTALAALLISQRSSRSVADVKTILAESADKIGPNTAGTQSEYKNDPYGICSCTWSEYFGYGRIDVFNALNASSGSPAPRFTLPVGAHLVATGAGMGGAPDVKAFNGSNLSVLASFLAYDSSFAGGVRVAVGDVNDDGRPDLVTGAGPGADPHVEVFDGASGSLLYSFDAYNPGFGGGVYVAVGDVNGDGKADVITGAGAGGGPHVEVFSGANGALLRSFYAYAPSFPGGVFVAAGDVNGDGNADVITGAGAGGGPHVEVFSGADGSLLRSFYAYAPSFAGGVRVASGDVNGDGKADIVTGAGTGGGPHVEVFNGADNSLLRSFYAYAPTFTGGVFVGAGDMNGDGKADVVTGAGAGGGPHVQVFSGADNSVLQSFFAYAPTFTGGVFVSGN